MSVSVIICTFNRGAMLDAAMQSLAQADHPPEMPWEVVIVDNNSTDDTPDVVRRWEADLRMRVVGVRETRQGKSFALNRGIAAARGDVLVFTDDDVEFDRCWLRRLIEPFAAPDVLGVGGRVEAVWSTAVPKWWSDAGEHRLALAVVHFDQGPEPEDLGDSAPPIGANMAFRRSVLERVGGFREDLGPTAGTLLRGEDTELGRRVMRGGGRVVYAPLALVRHPVEPHRARKSYFRRWYFDYGRTVVRRDGLPASCVLWAGVPRYLVRQIIGATGKALGLWWTRHAFYWELQVCETAGLIYEYWRTRRQATG